jgi:hypothetical protein
MENSEQQAAPERCCSSNKRRGERTVNSRERQDLRGWERGENTFVTKYIFVGRFGRRVENEGVAPLRKRLVAALNFSRPC